MRFFVLPIFDGVLMGSVAPPLHNIQRNKFTIYTHKTTLTLIPTLTCTPHSKTQYVSETAKEWNRKSARMLYRNETNIT